MHRSHLSATALRPGENRFGDVAVRHIHRLLSGVDVMGLDLAVVRSLLRCDVFDTLRSVDDDHRTEADRDRLRAFIDGWPFGRGRSGFRIRPPKGIPARNLKLISRIFGLDEIDEAILSFLLAIESSTATKEVLAAFGYMSRGVAGHMLAAAVGVAPGAVRTLFGGGRLVRSGLVETSRERNALFTDHIRALVGILDLVLVPGLDRAGVLSSFVTVAPLSSLEWRDFDGLGGAGVLRDLLGGAVADRARGINVLLYGETGSGKTELAYLLATTLGVDLFVAGNADHGDDGISWRERLSSLVLVQRLLEGSRSLLLFDEIEDLFEWSSPGSVGTGTRARAVVSKAWFNDLLESNAVPTIWITNTIEGIDPAFLRRFTFALHFGTIGPRQRARALSRHLRPSDAVSSDDILNIAQRHGVSPAMLRSAVCASRFLSSDRRASGKGIEQVLAPMERLVAAENLRSEAAFDAGGYRIEALRSSVDLVELADQLADWRPGDGPGVTLCLYGPTGTGKTEYARMLAHRMGRGVVYRRASDILDRWVGSTEKAIAQAFSEAASADALLLFDEVDTFLRDRRRAAFAWEVSPVNEFLRQLESFRGVAVCTTIPVNVGLKCRCDAVPRASVARGAAGALVDLRSVARCARSPRSRRSSNRFSTATRRVRRSPSRSA